MNASSLKDRLGAGLGGKAHPAAGEQPEAQPEQTEYPDGAGRADKHAVAGLYLQWPGAQEGESLSRGIYYPWMDEEPVLDVSVDGGERKETLTFGYSIRSGSYNVTVWGRNLRVVYDQLMQAKRLIIRVSGSQDTNPKEPFVTGIRVEKAKQEKKGP